MIYVLAKHNAAFNRMDRLIKVLMCSSFSPAGLRNILQKATRFSEILLVRPVPGHGQVNTLACPSKYPYAEHPFLA